MKLIQAISIMWYVVRGWDCHIIRIPGLSNTFFQTRGVGSSAGFKAFKIEFGILNSDSKACVSSLSNPSLAIKRYIWFGLLGENPLTKEFVQLS